ncbi:hypothetical protein JDFR1000234_24 [uncultured archaeal virus]|jgi:transposase-like protein|uniref:Uncharacterized protein n=1 Tax=uncultured archaeal virus TaxID=1960247 RepID=A0A1S5Y324_9VIRU|nr:hypothetical protein JDFR1000234_24 [uncultured archaeal virus]
MRIECPRCKSTDVKDLQPNYTLNPRHVFKCRKCLYSFCVDVNTGEIYDYWKDQR